MGFMQKKNNRKKYSKLMKKNMGRIINDTIAFYG